MGIRSELAMLDGEKEMMLHLEQFTSLSFFFFYSPKQVLHDVELHLCRELSTEKIPSNYSNTLGELAANSGAIIIFI